MDFRNIFFLLFASLLLFGSAYAEKSVNDFQIDESFNAAYNGNYHSLYLNEKQDSGVAVYKNIDVDDVDDGDAYDHMIHDEAHDYLGGDEDVVISKNPDSTFNFTDYDHASHGVGEVINSDGESFVVVFWAKDTSNAGDADLMSLLTQFNKDNGASAAAF